MFCSAESSEEDEASGDEGLPDEDSDVSQESHHLHQKAKGRVCADVSE